MRLKTKKSFTIVETLFAITLTIIIVLAFFNSLTLAFNYIRYQMELRTAHLILQEQVALVRELEFSDVQVLGGSFSSDNMDMLKDASGTILKSIYNGQSKMIKLTLSLDWTAFNGDPAERRIVTVITSDGIDKK